jgi:hypothetical protein
MSWNHITHSNKFITLYDIEATSNCCRKTLQSLDMRPPSLEVLRVNSPSHETISRASNSHFIPFLMKSWLLVILLNLVQLVSWFLNFGWIVLNLMLQLLINRWLLLLMRMHLEVEKLISLMWQVRGFV